MIPSLEHLYLRTWLFGFHQLIGKICLAFHRRVYPRLCVGKNPAIWGWFHVMMFPGGEITIGDNLHMVSEPSRSTTTLFGRAKFTVFPNAKISVGNHVALNGTAITSKKSVTIGDGTMIAQNVIIVDSDFHTQWPPDARHHSDTSAFDRPVSIGKNVWLGMNCLVLKGVSIGDNTIVGAGSVVVKSLPPNVLAAGNPARPIRPLTEDTLPPSTPSFYAG